VIVKKRKGCYRHVLDENRPPPTSVLPERSPLSLQQAMALANRHNEQLGLSGEDYVQALIEKNRAIANFLPTVGFQPSYTIRDSRERRHEQQHYNERLRVQGGTVRGGRGARRGEHQRLRGFGDVANLSASKRRSRSAASCCSTFSPPCC
jgi:hypothetical protein